MISIYVIIDNVAIQSMIYGKKKLFGVLRI